MDTFKNTFESDNSDKKAEEKTTNVDFDGLLEKIKINPQSTGWSELYKNFLTLSNWVFIVSAKHELETAKPFIGIVDEKSWVFIFTDGQKANEYCRQFDGFVRNDGSVLIMRLPVKEALNILYGLAQQGIYGMRVNDGAHGWFCPIQDLPNIIQHLNMTID